MKEVVKGRAPDSMDTLVQQTESLFTAEVLYFPLPAKFKMSQIEAFDGTNPLAILIPIRTRWSFMDINTRTVQSLCYHAKRPGIGLV